MENLKNYIGVKMIKAKEMTRYDFLIDVQGKKLEDVKEQEENQHGYLVIYPDGYKSWSPKNVFESAYYGLDCDNVITANDVANFIDDGKFTQLSDKSAVVTYTGKNRYTTTERMVELKNSTTTHFIIDLNFPNITLEFRF